MTDEQIREERGLGTEIPIIHNMRRYGSEYMGEYRGRTIFTKDGAWNIGGVEKECKKVYIASAR
jgi:hypothetical protein